ncbi:MAG: bifunctional serine/threonine-protein kinase/formylglycine-generating enzyme family protein [Phycisphaerales bacterium]
MDSEPANPPPSQTDDGHAAEARLVVDRAIRAARSASPGRPANRGIAGYEIVREIARGGQGVVYLARRLADGAEVAVKLLPEPRDMEATRRLRREARALAALDHPGIVAFGEVIEAGGSCALVMDYVPGVPLSLVLAELAAMGTPAADLRRVLTLLAQACRALEAAHAAGVVHRDIKPSNIRVRADGHACLLDFGLASQAVDAAGLGGVGGVGGAGPTISATLTGQGQFVGSLLWASPEQLRGKEATPASDIWSMGLILHHALTGGAPLYPGGASLGKLVRLASAGRVSIPERLVDALDELGPHAARDARRVLQDALMPAPGDRTPTAAALATQIEALASGAPVRARRATRRAWARRLGWGLSAALALGVLVVALPLLATTSPELPAVRYEGGILAPGEVRFINGTWRTTLGDKLILCWVPPGSAMLGTNPDPPRPWKPVLGDSPLREVAFERGFWIARDELRQLTYKAVVGENPSQFVDEARPVESVTYHDALAFCELASEKYGVRVRLPTSDEWEYACRAGTRTIFSFGDDVRLIARYANAADASNPDLIAAASYDDGYPDTAPVSSFLANAWGLHDTHGNVWEWCQGPYDSDPASPGDEIEARADSRGGSYMDGPGSMESGHRNPLPLDTRASTLGFRVVVDLPPPPEAPGRP